MEQQALQKEEDEASRKRLDMLEKNFLTKEREYAELEEVWKSEKAALSGSQHIKQALDAAKTEMEQARRGWRFKQNVTSFNTVAFQNWKNNLLPLKLVKAKK